MVLVNPGVGVSTPRVFAGLRDKFNPATTPMPPANRADWLAWLQEQRNDLQGPAIAAVPVIADVLDSLRALPGCHLARMSGSGATCFALFDKVDTDAVAELRHARPDWWVAETRLGSFGFGPPS